MLFNIGKNNLNNQEKEFDKIVAAQKDAAEKEYRANQNYCFQKEYSLPELPGQELEWTEKDKSTFFLAGKIQYLLNNAQGKPYEEFVDALRSNESDGEIVRMYMRKLSLPDNIIAISAGIVYYQGSSPSLKVIIPSKKQFRSKMKNQMGPLSRYM